MQVNLALGRWAQFGQTLPEGLGTEAEVAAFLAGRQKRLECIFGNSRRASRLRKRAQAHIEVAEMILTAIRSPLGAHREVACARDAFASRYAHEKDVRAKASRGGSFADPASIPRSYAAIADRHHQLSGAFPWACALIRSRQPRA